MLEHTAAEKLCAPLLLAFSESGSHRMGTLSQLTDLQGDINDGPYQQLLRISRNEYGM